MNLLQRTKGHAYEGQVLHRTPFLGERDLLWWFAKWLNRYSNGESIIGIFRNIISFIIVVSAGMKIFDLPDAAIATAALLIVFGFAGVYLTLGTWNEHRGFWKVQNRINSRETNPVLAKIASQVDELHKTRNRK